MAIVIHNALIYVPSPQRCRGRIHVFGSSCATRGSPCA